MHQNPRKTGIYILGGHGLRRTPQMALCPHPPPPSHIIVLLPHWVAYFHYTRHRPSLSMASDTHVKLLNDKTVTDLCNNKASS